MLEFGQVQNVNDWYATSSYVSYNQLFRLSGWSPREIEYFDIPTVEHCTIYCERYTGCLFIDRRKKNYLWGNDGDT